MSQVMEEEIKRWTARRKSALVLRELFTLSDKQVEHDRLFTKRLYLQFSGIIRRLSFKSHANPGPML